MTDHRRSLANAPWRTSTYTKAGGNNCVEVAPLPDIVGVRDTKNRDGGSLVVSRGAWAAFVGSITAR